MRHMLGLITHTRESMYGEVCLKSRVEDLLGKIKVMKGDLEQKEVQASVQKGSSRLSNPGRGYRYRYSGEPTPQIRKGGL